MARWSLTAQFLRLRMLFYVVLCLSCRRRLRRSSSVLEGYGGRGVAKWST